MDDDVHLRLGQTEQQGGLDDLEALVHQGRGIDRNLAAHFPLRMGAGLIRRDVGQAAGLGGAERAAGGG